MIAFNYDGQGSPLLRLPDGELTAGIGIGELEEMLFGGGPDYNDGICLELLE